MNQMNSQDNSFWKSIPGILTGLAAIITALTGVYLATDKEADTNPNPEPEITWEMVAFETFSEPGEPWPAGWPTTTYSNEHVMVSRAVTENKYRWDLEFFNGRNIWQESPYSTAANYKLGVDVQFIEHDSEGQTAGLMFGHTDKSQYTFRISTRGNYALQEWDSDSDSWNEILSWRPANISLSVPNRLSVTVINDIIQLYINDELIDEASAPFLPGGRFGLIVLGFAGDHMVVDFDNFEYKRLAS